MTKFFPKPISYLLAALTACPLLTAHQALSATHKAICSYYSAYEPCLVTVSNSQITANVPGDFILIDSNNFLGSELYEATGKGSNIAVGITTTILFGPIGLLGFLVTKKIGTVDFGFSFRNDKNKKKTFFVRFKNLRAAENFGNDIKGFLEINSSAPGLQDKEGSIIEPLS